MSARKLTVSESACDKIIGVMKHYNIGDTAYIVRHTPWWPSDEEKAKLEADGRCVIDEAYSRERDEVFPSLVKAIAHARKVRKSSFWGIAEVFEARLTNPYSGDIPDHRIKRSALAWAPTGEYECEVGQ